MRLKTPPIALLLLLAGPALAQAPGPAGTNLSPHDTQLLRAYRLSLKKVEAAQQVNEAIAHLTAQDPKLASLLKAAQTDPGGLTHGIQALQANPKLKEALGRARISARDYVLTTAAVAQAYLVSAMNPGPGAQLPPALDPSHLAFVKAHPREVERLWKSIQDLQPPDSAGP